MINGVIPTAADRTYTSPVENMGEIGAVDIGKDPMKIVGKIGCDNSTADAVGGTPE